MKRIIELKVNGEVHETLVETHRTLLEVLRENIGLVGTKEACDTGECGACAVLLDGIPVNSCLVLALDGRGKEITTIEGLMVNGKLHPLQKAFMENDSLQCGYCTPGMIMNAYSLLHKNPRSSTSEMIAGMDNNLCRCGAHPRIVRAMQAAAKEMEGGF